MNGSGQILSRFQDIPDLAALTPTVGQAYVKGSTGWSLKTPATTDGSYADPAWITSLAASKISGAFTTITFDGEISFADAANGSAEAARLTSDFFYFRNNQAIQGANWQGSQITSAYLPTLDAIAAPVADVSLNGHAITNGTWNAGRINAAVVGNEHVLKGTWTGENVLAIQGGSTTSIPAIRFLRTDASEHGAVGITDIAGGPAGITFVESSDLAGGAPPPLMFLQTGVPTGSGLSAAQRQRTVYNSDGMVWHTAANGIDRIVQYGPTANDSYIITAPTCYIANNVSGGVGVGQVVVNNSATGYAYLGVRNDASKQLFLQVYGSTYGGTPLVPGVSGNNLGAFFHTFDNFVIGSYLDTPLIFSRSGSELFRLDSTSQVTYATGVTLLAKGLLKAGSTPTTLTDSAGKILSAALNTVGTTVGGTGLPSYAIGDTLYASATNTLAALPANSTATQKFLSMTSSVPSWATVTVPTAADSAVSVGLTRSVGTATTWKRSDASDPLDVSIAPTWTGLHTFGKNVTVTGSTDAIQLDVKGNATQTSNVVRVRNSANTVIYSLTNAGAAFFGDVIQSQSAIQGIYFADYNNSAGFWTTAADSTHAWQFTNRTATKVPLSVLLAASQSANALEVTSSGGTAGDIFKMSSAGALTIPASGAASAPATKWTGTPFGNATTGFGLRDVNESTATASTTLNTLGVYDRINAHISGADAYCVQLDGVNKVNILTTGTATFAGNVTCAIGFISNVSTTLVQGGGANSTLRLQNQGDGAQANFTAVRMATGTMTASSGVSNPVAINPTYNQTSTAGSVDLAITRTETALGSGTHYFQLFKAGTLGTTIKYYLDNTGRAFLANSSAPSTPTGGGVIFVDGSGNLKYIGPSGTTTQLAAA